MPLRKENHIPQTMMEKFPLAIFMKHAVTFLKNFPRRRREKEPTNTCRIHPHELVQIWIGVLVEDHAAIFHKAEINEKQIDDRLSQLAEHEINIKAKAPIELTDNN